MWGGRPLGDPAGAWPRGCELEDPLPAGPNLTPVSSLTRRARTFLMLPWAEQRVVGELVWELGRARWELRRRPFKEIAGTLGAVGGLTPFEVAPHPLPLRVKGFIESLVPLLPWESLCLVQALAARRVLDRRGVPTTLYLGVRREGEALKAHAWLRWGSRHLTGGPGHEAYRVVASFA